MNAICSTISVFFIIFLVIMVWLESKGKINFSDKLGFAVIYLIDYLLILFPYYFETIFNAPNIDKNIFASKFLQELINNIPEILVLFAILLSNFLTKLLYNKLCNIEDLSKINKVHQNIISGLILSLTIIAIPFGDFGLFFAYALFGIGNQIGYSIHKSQEEKLNKKDYLLIGLTAIISNALLVLFSLGSKYLSKYKFYFLIPWVITIFLLLTVVISVLIKRYHTSQKHIKKHIQKDIQE